MSLFRKKCLDEHSCSKEDTKRKEIEKDVLMQAFSSVVAKIPSDKISKLITSTFRHD